MMREELPKPMLAALFLAVVLGMQYWGGAYQAEYAAAADESAHAVTSLMIRDYLLTWPLQDPIAWAAQYYIHYPKVAIGHWPPGYFVAQGLWWIVFPPGRASAMAFNAVTAVAVAMLFYSLARRVAPRYWALGATLLLLLARDMQDAYSQTMAELLSLLGALLAVRALIRAVEQPGLRALAIAGVWLLVTLLVKAAAIGLVPGALLALLAGGVLPRLGRAAYPAVALAALTLLPVAGWYLWQSGQGRMSLSRLGGFTANIPWRIDLLASVAGYGVLAAAIGGVAIGFWRRYPAALVPAALLTGMAGTAYFLRAMRESRHWIYAIPLLLLLALTLRAELAPRTAWAWLVAAAVLVFPFRLQRQEPLGFASMVQQVHLPARMLVSSPSGWSEGPWIAAVSLAERRPGSTILRATKSLVSTDWNSNRYSILAASPEAMERVLDEGGVDTVVLHDGVVDEKRLVHHDQLKAMLQESSRWRHCAAAGELTAYCRTEPPRYPRQPIRIDLRQHIGRVIEEGTR